MFDAVEPLVEALLPGVCPACTTSSPSTQSLWAKVRANGGGAQPGSTAGNDSA